MRVCAFVALLLSFCPVVFAGDKVPETPDFTGSYTGTWAASEGGIRGVLEVKLRRDAKAAWVTDAVFTLDGARASTVTKSVTVEAARIVVVFDWKLRDVPGQSRITGQLAGDTLSGDYETTTDEGRQFGTWTVTRGPAADKTKVGP